MLARTLICLTNDGDKLLVFACERARGRGRANISLRKFLQNSADNGETELWGIRVPKCDGAYTIIHLSRYATPTNTHTYTRKVTVIGTSPRVPAQPTNSTQKKSRPRSLLCLCALERVAAPRCASIVASATTVAMMMMFQYNAQFSLATPAGARWRAAFGCLQSAKR